MAAGNVADGEGHGKQREAKGQGNSGETNTDSRESGRQNGCAASTEDQPECSEEFRGYAFSDGHGTLLKNFRFLIADLRLIGKPCELESAIGDGKTVNSRFCAAEA
jgi:hypothetical protein